MKNIFNFSGCYNFKDSLLNNEIEGYNNGQYLWITYCSIFYKMEYIQNHCLNHYEMGDPYYLINKDYHYPDECKILEQLKALEDKMKSKTTIDDIIEETLAYTNIYKYPLIIPKYTEEVYLTGIPKIVPNQHLYTASPPYDFDDELFTTSLKNFLKIRYHCLYDNRYEKENKNNSQSITNIIKTVLANNDQCKYNLKGSIESECNRFFNNKKIYTNIIKSKSVKCRFAEDELFLNKPYSIFDYLIISLRHCSPLLYYLDNDNNCLDKPKQSSTIVKKIQSALSRSPFIIYYNTYKDSMDIHAINYITERLLNINLLNKIYTYTDQVSTSELYNCEREKSPLDYLVLYPLLDFRLHLVDCKLPAHQLSSIVNHHVFHYIPIVCKLFDFIVCLYNKKYKDTALKYKKISEDYLRFFKVNNKFKPNIVPSYQFPDKHTEQIGCSASYNYTDTYLSMQYLFETAVSSFGKEEDYLQFTTFQSADFY